MADVNLTVPIPRGCSAPTVVLAVPNGSTVIIQELTGSVSNDGKQHQESDTYSIIYKDTYR